MGKTGAQDSVTKHHISWRSVDVLHIPLVQCLEGKDYFTRPSSYMTTTFSLYLSLLKSYY